MYSSRGEIPQGRNLGSHSEPTAFWGEESQPTWNS